MVRLPLRGRRGSGGVRATSAGEPSRRDLGFQRDGELGGRMGPEPIKVLLVEDDEKDFVILRDLLRKVGDQRFQLHRVSTYEAGLKAARSSRYDVFLVEFCLGEHDGLKLLRELGHDDRGGPVILLTGDEDRTVALRALKEGAADYLDKNTMNRQVLERSMRYAIERFRNLGALEESQKKLHRLSSQLIEAQERERKLVAQELHDSIGASLTAIIYALEEVLTAGCEHCVSQVREVISLVRNTMDETRRISTSLRPSILDDLGVLATFRWFCGEFQKLCADLRIETRLDLRERDVPDPVKIVMYRVLQEALNNAAKHSGADIVSVTLRRRKAGGVELTIKDNGRGFDVEKTLRDRDATSAMGLANMRERTELSGGALTIRSGKGRGTVIRASWLLSG
jgi:signal transduction histidine kinase